MPERPDLDRQLLAVARAMGSLDHPHKSETSAWAAANLAQRDRVRADRESDFAAEDWQRCADRGVLGVMVPESMGGQGLDLADALLTLEGLGHGCRDNGLSFAIGSQILSTQDALVRFGTDEQRERWLGPLLRGEIRGSFAMTEADSGSDAYSMASRAVRQSDGSYVLSGSKAHITLGPRCDVVIVFAVTRPEAGSFGVSTFVVPTDLAGVSRTENHEKMGMRTTPFGDLAFDDVRLPATALLGREGAGASIFNAILLVERSFVFATQLGAMQYQLERAGTYAQQREQGGQPIGRYQAVAHRLADIKLHHETARLFTYRAAIAHLTGDDVMMAAALAKIVASEAGITAAMEAALIHGATGYVSSYEVERDVRDAIGGAVYSGTTDIQKNIVARLLGAG